MKKTLQIAMILQLFLAAPVVSAQEELNSEVMQDDLGNVTDEFQEYFFEALKQKAIENHEKAITALERCLDIDPKPVVYFELGKNYNALERFEEAAIHLEKAKGLDKGNEAVLAELYNTYYLSEQYVLALPVVEELQGLNPVYSEDLANLYLLNERFEEALALLDTLDLQWGESDYREGLRRQIYTKTGNTTAGIENLQQKIAENPEKQKHYLDLIYLYSELGKEAKAIELAQETLKKFPDSEILHLALYKFYLVGQETELAVSSMKIVLQGKTIDEDTKYQVLNDFLLFVDQHPDREAELMEITEVFSADEGNTKVFAELGSFYLQRNNKLKALEYFEAGVANGDLEFDLLVKTLLLQLEFGKTDEADGLSERALEEYPSQPVLYLVRGSVLNRSGEFKKAEEMLSFGLDFLIDNPILEVDFYLQLAVAYKGMNETAKAMDFETRAANLKKEIENE